MTDITVEALIAMPWKEKAADQLNMTYKGLSNLGGGEDWEVAIFDDSKDSTHAEEFEKRGYTVLRGKTDHLTTVEERITHARNKLREYFLEGDYTHVFWYESDIIPPKKCIEALAATQADNITAVRPQHGAMPGVFPFRGDLPRNLYTTHSLPNFTPVTWEWLCPSRLAEISCYGTGCNLISRQATEKAEFWVKPYSPCTHDIVYSMDLQVLGFPAYCLTGLLCAHHYKPMKRPDERFDYGGDWSNLDQHRRHTIQWKDKLK